MSRLSSIYIINSLLSATSGLSVRHTSPGGLLGSLYFLLAKLPRCCQRRPNKALQTLDLCRRIPNALCFRKLMLVHPRVDRLVVPEVFSCRLGSSASAMNVVQKSVTAKVAVRISESRREGGVVIEIYSDHFYTLNREGLKGDGGGFAYRAMDAL